MGKKGLTHIEIVLSFVLFTAAIGFALFFFNPGNIEKFVDTSLDYAFREVLDSVTIPAESYFVRINNEGDDLEDVEFINFRIIRYDDEKNPKMGLQGGLLEEMLEFPDNVYSNKDPPLGGWDSYDYISIIFTEEFQIEQGVGAPAADYDFYELGSSEIKNVVSEMKVVELQTAYNSDYPALKELFNLPDRADFAFALRFETGEEILAERPIPSSLEVFSENRKVEVLRANGEEVDFADLIIKVW